jgi:hypothetical protein
LQFEESPWGAFEIGAAVCRISKLDASTILPRAIRLTARMRMVRLTRDFFEILRFYLRFEAKNAFLKNDSEAVVNKSECALFLLSCSNPGPH